MLIIIVVCCWKVFKYDLACLVYGHCDLFNNAPQYQLFFFIFFVLARYHYSQCNEFIICQALSVWVAASNLAQKNYNWRLLETFFQQRASKVRMTHLKKKTIYQNMVLIFIYNIFCTKMLYILLSRAATNDFINQVTYLVSHTTLYKHFHHMRIEIRKG